ncbi:DUF106 domain-containing protein [Candidatus Pacearchaeota archaeon]|nr:DUF106 domain-containing protein [Candidatus Pacearchaeota archaeon]
MDKEAKEGNFKPIIYIMIISLAIAFLWDSIEIIKNSVHSILDPSIGALIMWNLTIGMSIIVFLISVFMTLVQKYATDQETLKEMKKEQKILQKEMDTYKNDPAKLMELQKKSFAFIPKTFKLSMRAIAYTGIPLILLFRWFMDFFITIGDPRFLGFLNWFWFYLLASIIFSSILKKYLNVV